ncbi:DUF1289 domain-containing protein [Haloplanus salinus]|uniref:DUF1289 domain-containing protein n=1 Tax=Haloplanus salinus TaxID=1126245 RepID=UPI0011C076D4|nr:DUF1289 domain-containing protein [Haloplanus salinus]
MTSSPCVGVCDPESGVRVARTRTLEDIATRAAMTEAERIERMQELDVPDGGGA